MEIVVHNQLQMGRALWALGQQAVVHLQVLSLLVFQHQQQAVVLLRLLLLLSALPHLAATLDFGLPPANAAGSSTPSFGVSISSATAPAAAPPAPFPFGVSISTGPDNAPAAPSAAASAPSFTFGAPASASAAAPSSTPTYSFGAPASTNAAPSMSFRFGAGSGHAAAASFAFGGLCSSVAAASGPSSHLPVGNGGVALAPLELLHLQQRQQHQIPLAVLLMLAVADYHLLTHSGFHLEHHLLLLLLNQLLPGFRAPSSAHAFGGSQSTSSSGAFGASGGITFEAPAATPVPAMATSPFGVLHLVHHSRLQHHLVSPSSSNSQHPLHLAHHSSSSSSSNPIQSIWVGPGSSTWWLHVWGSASIATAAAAAVRVWSRTVRSTTTAAAAACICRIFGAGGSGGAQGAPAFGAAPAAAAGGEGQMFAMGHQQGKNIHQGSRRVVRARRKGK